MWSVSQSSICNLWMSYCSRTLVQKVFLCLLNCFCIFVKSLLEIFVCVYFSVLYMSYRFVNLTFCQYQVVLIILVRQQVLKLVRLIPTLFLFFKIILAILSSLPFCIKFRIIISISTKIFIRIWIGIFQIVLQHFFFWSKIQSRISHCF